MSDSKCVIIVNESLPIGQLTNTVAVLALSLGKKHPEMVGCDLLDCDGHTHTGITTFPIPVLKAGDKLEKIRAALNRHPELTVVDVISATSVTRSYEEYAQEMKKSSIEKLNYYGVAIYGPKKLVNQYTGSLGLLR
jgi:hypothetical protein